MEFLHGILCNFKWLMHPIKMSDTIEMAPILTGVIVWSHLMLTPLVGSVCQNHFRNVLMVLSFINFKTQFHTVVLFVKFNMLLHLDPELCKTFFSLIVVVVNYTYMQKFHFV